MNPASGLMPIGNVPEYTMIQAFQVQVLTHVMAYRLCFRIAEMVKSTISLPNQSADFPETQQIVCQLSEN